MWKAYLESRKFNKITRKGRGGKLATAPIFALSFIKRKKRSKVINKSVENVDKPKTDKTGNAGKKPRGKYAKV